jgi:transcriptional regulator with GAF, ATPase, and Fis domain
LAGSAFRLTRFNSARGAFTGAITQKRGKLEVADGGTLFLDGVGELAAGIQAKLLGLHPSNLHRLIRDLDLKSSLQKEHDEEKV